MIEGTLAAQKWTRVAYGWGKFSIAYSVHLSREVRGKYRCYTTPLPWPISAGPLPDEVTHHVYGYGDVWLYAEDRADYFMIPVS